jgi:hypothetical protein
LNFVQNLENSEEVLTNLVPHVVQQLEKFSPSDCAELATCFASHEISAPELYEAIGRIIASHAYDMSLSQLVQVTSWLMGKMHDNSAILLVAEKRLKRNIEQLNLDEKIAVAGMYKSLDSGHEMMMIVESYVSEVLSTMSGE